MGSGGLKIVASSLKLVGKKSSPCQLKKGMSESGQEREEKKANGPSNEKQFVPEQGKGNRNPVGAADLKGKNEEHFAIKQGPRRGLSRGFGWTNLTVDLLKEARVGGSTDSPIREGGFFTH